MTSPGSSAISPSSVSASLPCRSIFSLLCNTMSSIEIGKIRIWKSAARSFLRKRTRSFRASFPNVITKRNDLIIPNKLSRLSKPCSKLLLGFHNECQTLREETRQHGPGELYPHVHICPRMLLVTIQLPPLKTLWMSYDPFPAFCNERERLDKTGLD